MAGPIRIAILANASQAKKEVGGLGSTFKKTLGIAGAAIGGAAIIGGVKAIVGAASDAQQSLGGTQAVFGKYSKSVIADSNAAAGAFGLSANQYRESANLIGSLLKNQGVSQDKLGSSTKNLVRTGADLAATYGGTAASAVEALGSAFKGEFDPLQQYGITLKQSTINVEAMRVAHVDSTAAFNKLSTAQQQAAQRQATQNLIAKQSTDAAGQFQKQTNTLAEQQQILAARFENVKAKLGNFLLPILTAVFLFLSSTAIPKAQELGEKLQGPLAQGVDLARDAFAKIQPIVSAVIGFIQRNPKTVVAFAIALGVMAAAFGIATLAAAAFTAVLAVNPISLVILAIAALAAGLTYLYTRSKTARAIMDAAFAGIKLGVQVAWKIIQPILKLWLSEIKALGAIATWLWNNGFRPALVFIVRGLAVLMDIWAKMLHALGHVPGFGWAKSAGDAMSAAADKARGLTSAISNIPTSHSVDVVLNIVRGVVHTTGGHVPLDTSQPSTRSGRLLMDVSGSSRRSAANRPGTVVNVYPPVTSDPYTVGEAIRSALDAYEAAG